MRRLLTVLTVTFLLTLGAAATPSMGAASTDEMGVERAGRYYLKSVCPANAAGERFNRVVWHGQNSIKFSEVKRRLPELRKESAKYGRALQKFAGKLFNPPGAWPASVEQYVNRYASMNAREADIRTRQADAHSAAAWSNLNGQANNVPYGHLAAQIRARLALPPPGEGC